MKRTTTAVVLLSMLAVVSFASAQDGENELGATQRETGSGAPEGAAKARSRSGAGAPSVTAPAAGTPKGAEPAPEPMMPTGGDSGAAPGGADAAAGTPATGAAGSHGAAVDALPPTPPADAVAPAATAAGAAPGLMALHDPNLKSIFQSVSHEKPRLILEDAAAVSLATDDRTYFEWLIEKGNRDILDGAVSIVAEASAEAAEGYSKSVAQLFGIVVADDDEYATMNEVAFNAIGSLQRGVPYVMPPAPPITSRDGSTWTQPEASTVAGSVDSMFYFILYLSAFCFIAITIATIVFTIRYRHRKGHRAEDSPSHNDALEITWTVVPSLLLVVVFILGWKGFVNMMTPPRHGLEVQVVGQKWNWTFIHPNGWADDVLHVPADMPVRLVMRSEDVIHDFSVPAFRVKQDVIPRRYTKIWFQANTPGVYRAFCAEYCGQQHSDMKTWVQVHGPGGYEKYLEKAEEAEKLLKPIDVGKTYYAKRGCAQCHSVDGKAGTGPTFKGIWGQERQFTDGSSGVVDENYIRESILEPQAKVRAGYNPVMPTFKGKLKDHQIDGLIEYIKSLK